MVRRAVRHRELAHGDSCGAVAKAHHGGDGDGPCADARAHRALRADTLTRNLRVGRVIRMLGQPGGDGCR